MRYGAAIGTVALAVAARRLLDPWLGDLYPYPTFFLAVLVTAAFWGTGPGVTAAVFGELAVNFFLIQPRNEFTIEDRAHNLGQILNLLIGVGIALIGGAMRKARTAAEDVAAAERRQQEQLRSVLANALDGIVSIDARGTIQSFNPAAERLFGYEAAEIVDHNVSILMPEPYRGEHDQYLANYLRTGIPKVIGIGREVTGRRKDGSIFPLEVAVSEFRLDGQPYFTAVLHDLTARHALERQLRVAQKMEAFGQLAGGVAHDFNNLLTIILGYSEMLLEEIQEPQRALVSDIHDAGERAAALTRQLLAFSRQQVLEPKVLDLNQIVIGIEKMLRRLIGEDIALASRLDMAIAAVMVDPGQIEQVIMNLVVNARDAMPQGGKITMETSNIDWREEDRRPDLDWKPGRYVMLSITDSGFGMTPEIQSQIFEPFFTTKDPGKGTGLGLATVFGIIKQSDGHVRVYSEVGVGTVFKIYLPAVDKTAAEPLGRQEGDHRARGAETILLVEDEIKVGEIATLILESRGYRVLTTTRGDDAIAIFDAEGDAIDLVVTDVVMPEMSGRRLMQTLRERRADVRVLFISGYTDDAIVRHGIIEAKEFFLQKPFSPFALAKKVREVLDVKKS